MLGTASKPALVWLSAMGITIGAGCRLSEQGTPDRRSGAPAGHSGGRGGFAAGDALCLRAGHLPPAGDLSERSAGIHRPRGRDPERRHGADELDQRIRVLGTHGPPPTRCRSRGNAVSAGTSATDAKICSSMASPTNGWPAWTTSARGRGTTGVGLYVGSGTQVRGGNFSHNGRLGMGGSGNGFTVQGAEIAFNNYAGYDSGWEAGCSKETIYPGTMAAAGTTGCGLADPRAEQPERRGS